ncbi:hypothetical protein GCM10011399_32830 [Subtercola lobariae]|uniref:Uncharacterized protein n=1 Tax=Subtercola lobariae TaxID=1588641 RepID=A0A917BE79_9MICO|nr:hypothetical protein GCM10011399_32830 [Subtercola lobariae]
MLNTCIKGFFAAVGVVGVGVGLLWVPVPAAAPFDAAAEDVAPGVVDEFGADVTVLVGDAVTGAPVVTVVGLNRMKASSTITARSRTPITPRITSNGTFRGRGEGTGCGSGETGVLTRFSLRRSRPESAVVRRRTERCGCPGHISYNAFLLRRLSVGMGCRKE